MNELEKSIRNVLSKISDGGKGPSSTVKHRIFEQVNSNIGKKQKTIRNKTVWVMMTALFLLASISVSAAISPIEWNGMKFTILDDGGRNERIDMIKEQIFGPSPSYKQLIEDTLDHTKNMKKTLTLEEAQKEFPFAILRPQQYDVQPYRSTGALMNANLQHEDGSVEIIGYNPVFHDFYELDNDWVVVTQTLDESATEFLQAELEGKSVSSSGTFVGKWESINVTDEIMAMFNEGKKGNRLLLNYRTDRIQVLRINIVGTVEKEALVGLATSYVSQLND
jgi:hypothetical protein